MNLTFPSFDQRVDVVIRGVGVSIPVQRNRIHFGEVVVFIGVKEIMACDRDIAADMVLGWGIGAVRRSEVIVVVILFGLFALDLNAVAVSGRVRENGDDVGETVDLSHSEK